MRIAFFSSNPSDYHLANKTLFSFSLHVFLFFSRHPKGTCFLFYFSRARVDIFLLFLFSPDIYILDFEPACSQVTHEPYNPPYEVGAPKRQSGHSVYKGIDPRLIYRIRYYSGENTYRYHGSKNPNNTLTPDGLRSPPPSGVG
jgi:hypothetical protein